MRYIHIFLFCLIWSIGSAQVINNPYGDKTKKNKRYLPTGDVDSEANDDSSTTANTSSVESTIQSLFDFMLAADGSGVSSLFTDDARLNTTGTNESGITEVREVAISDFSASIDKAQPGDLREEIQIKRVDIDGPLASAWVDYTFYFKDQFSHCGVDAFQLIQTNSGWKIFQIADTRRTENCSELPETTINQLLDDWHMAASKADLKGYFGLIAADGYYLGTDPGEIWTKDAFLQFAKPYFDKGRAWSFTAKERNVAIGDDGDIAWFNEVLDTWMGPCRGSGIMIKEDDGWKLKQYNLAILVPNDKVNGYLDLIGKNN